MIEEPPLVRVVPPSRRNRPTAAQIEAFRGAQTGHVCDAMFGSGALGMAIKPLPGLPGSVCGPALTADCGPADILALLCALTEVSHGDVLVASVHGHQECAALGDMVAGMARNAGAAGIVTDGPARDLAGLEAVGLPVYATGLTPNSPFSNGPGTVGYPVTLTGRLIATGDIILGDRDGVVVVPFEDIDATLARLVQVRAAETALEAQVSDGLIAPTAIRELMDSDKVARDHGGTR